MTRKQRVEDLINNLESFYSYLEDLPNIDLVKQWQATCVTDRKYAYIDTLIEEKHIRMGHTAGVIEGLKLLNMFSVTDAISGNLFDKLIQCAEANWKVFLSFDKESITKTGE